MKKYKLSIFPGNYQLEVEENTNIKDAINAIGLLFDFPCGGKGTCGKCRIKVQSGYIEPTPEEKLLLSEKEIIEGIRLACHSHVLSDLTIKLEDHMSNYYNILTSSKDRPIEIEPKVTKRCLMVEKADINKPVSDLSRVRESLSITGFDKSVKEVSLASLRALPDLIRKDQNKLAVISDDKSILGIEPGISSDVMLGMSFDIGTTTIVGYVLDMTTGAELGTISSLNPQFSYGADVITRISYIRKTGEGLKKLHKILIQEVNRLIIEAANKYSFSIGNLYCISFAGNTCMQHFLLGISPAYLVEAPYTPVFTESIYISSKELGIEINPFGRVLVIPNIAGYVGGDTTAVILSTGLYKSKDIKLAIDIGTNGELVLGSEKLMAACSVAAGPAFEGAHISCGMRGTVGAIDHVFLDNIINYSVIGGTKPLGICGSGLLDAIAGLMHIGIVNNRGRLLSPDEIHEGRAKAFVGHIVKHDGSNAFKLVDESDTLNGRPVIITQNDITSLQLAKGAIRAGIEILIEEMGITYDDIGEVLLAGAFGNYLNVDSACDIGLIPREFRGKTSMIGNAAGMGAKRVLLCKKEFELCDNIVKNIRYIELFTHKRFNHKFAEGMRLC